MELTLFVDHQCNLRCTYCYNGQKFTRPMSLETARKAVDLALSMTYDQLDLSLFGGEPLLRLELLEQITEYAEAAIAKLPQPRPRLRIILNTNATLIDERALAWMASPRVVVAFVSLDGARPVHDRFRIHASGTGSFDDVLRGIDKLRERKIPYHFVSVVSRDTAPFLASTLRALLPLGAGRILLAPNFRDDWNDDSIALLRQGLREAAQVWMERFRLGQAVSLEPLHGKILTHLKGGIPCPSRCTLGGHEFAVAPSGRIYPCAQMIGEDNDGALVIGHVDSGMDRSRLAELQKQKDQVEQTCAPCALRDRCQSHCGCRHVALSGQLGQITATLCEIESAMIETADWVAEQLYQEGCETFLDYYYRKNWSVARGGQLSTIRRSREA